MAQVDKVQLKNLNCAIFNQSNPVISIITKNGIKVTNSKQYIKLLYVKIKSSLRFSCKKPVEQRLRAN